MMDFNPDLDLRIEREIGAKPETIWRCWTDPDLLAQWFAPKPFTVKDIAYDFVPGGRANLTMVLDDGTEMPLKGCVLEADPARRLVTTDALLGGYRPNAAPFMTAIYDLEPHGDSTLYRATVLHGDVEARKRHEEMGFHEGWATVIRQLGDLAMTLKEKTS
ncbi:SRPBCC family protein [Tateyamaria omphalii]|uniref:SRPBCC family protein n=1 Tax=Tateyamaria omphalii TaxID=299262 RepID=UPI001C99BB86|nr:SRPBCC family protein [Tateyamaria omphalii]MBY5935215.1 SRPBCC family protein [Tateyamaria omphalii]